MSLTSLFQLGLQPCLSCCNIQGQHLHTSSKTAVLAMLYAEDELSLEALLVNMSQR